MAQGQIVIYAGLVIGALALISTCIVWMRKQVMGLGGTVLSLVGVVLMGLSIWKNVEISVDKDGVEAKFRALEEQVGTVAAATRLATESVQKVAEARSADQARVADLVASLHTAGPRNELSAFRAEAAKPMLNLEELKGANARLLSIERSRQVVGGER
jgi:hypothetical protein